MIFGLKTKLLRLVIYMFKGDDMKNTFKDDVLEASKKFDKVRDIVKYLQKSYNVKKEDHRTFYNRVQKCLKRIKAKQFVEKVVVIQNTEPEVHEKNGMALRQLRLLLWETLN